MVIRPSLSNWSGELSNQKQMSNLEVFLMRFSENSNQKQQIELKCFWSNIDSWYKEPLGTSQTPRQRRWKHSVDSNYWTPCLSEPYSGVPCQTGFKS